MTLTPEQRAAAIEAMARNMCRGEGSDPDRLDTLYSVPRWKTHRVAARLALDAALPIIEAAIVSDKPRCDELVSDKPGGDNG